MNKSDLNPKHLTLIDKAIKIAFPNSTWTTETWPSGGLSVSKVYKVAIAEKSYVVRLSDPAHPHHNLGREYHALQLDG